MIETTIIIIIIKTKIIQIKLLSNQINGASFEIT